ncbi:hypothetical protein GCM10025875_11050 [Litorihabitans aurantiacus]|uniref:Proteasome endopeptidase complex n=1 Tax=Litorihabitans aurantiacus TaxID=1930061 RepID=A0AA37UHU8_9MICO|nr:hypothetical protein GCM10025875_11050 [Litorihabitans aurantiacus]
MTLGPRLPASYLAPGTSSFVDFVGDVAPELLAARQQHARPGEADLEQAHATTIVALTHPGGVVMAGDRRATSGTYIAHREIEKVFAADEASVIGIAGAAGIGLDLVRLFQLELEHYEKLEGTPLSLEGKANRLARLVRANLPWRHRVWSRFRCSAGSTAQRPPAPTARTRPDPAASTPTTSSAAGTRSGTTTASGRAPCSRAAA